MHGCRSISHEIESGGSSGIPQELQQIRQNDGDSIVPQVARDVVRRRWPLELLSRHCKEGFGDANWKRLELVRELRLEHLSLGIQGMGGEIRNPMDVARHKVLLDVIQTDKLAESIKVRQRLRESRV